MENNNNFLNQDNLQDLQNRLQIVANMWNNSNFNLNQDNLQNLQHCLQIVANMWSNNDFDLIQEEQNIKMPVELKNKETQKIYNEFLDMLKLLELYKEEICDLKTVVFDFLYNKMAEVKSDGYSHTTKFLNELRKKIKEILKNAFNCIAKQRVLVKEHRYKMLREIYYESHDIKNTINILKQLEENMRFTSKLVEEYKENIGDILNSITNYCGKQFFEEELKTKQKYEEKEEEEKKQEEDDENDDVEEDEKYKLEEKEYNVEEDENDDV